MRLVQRDGETQSLQVLLLLQQVGQLLLPSHAQETHKHISILHTSSSNCDVWTLDASAHCLSSEIFPDYYLILAIIALFYLYYWRQKEYVSLCECTQTSQSKHANV